MDAFKRLQEFQMDVLKEVGNIGAGHAATALSTLLNKPVDMQVPKVRMLPFEEISASVGGAEQVVLAIFLRVDGDAPGNMFFIVTMESAKKLLKNLIGLETVSEDGEFTELELSALNEIGNTYVEIPEFNGKDDFLKALKESKIHRYRASPLVHFSSTWTKLKKTFEGN